MAKQNEHEAAKQAICKGCQQAAFANHAYFSPVIATMGIADTDGSALGQPHGNHKCEGGAVHGNLMSSLFYCANRSNQDCGNGENAHFHAGLQTAGYSDAE